ncbi:hypothetical protein [Adhaeretor mobilis]|uniref:Uncharacterized protein n=1 Tax=Adhaeretor mobilis TaxID=1930276 RepID=A0A517MY78_9BACT|nr:hypothetical protein [Adhaeretor mobilis]QDS99840.1 hypothetical protein HG15A2_31710 [Adhaeretor mobilis]
MNVSRYLKLVAATLAVALIVPTASSALGQAVGTEQFLAASEAAFEEAPISTPTDTSDFQFVDDFTLPTTSNTSVIEDRWVRPTQAQTRGNRNDAVRVANRSRRSARTPYMIGDSPGEEYDMFGPHSNGLTVDGLDMLSVNHPALTGNRFNASEAGSFLPTDRVFFSYRHLHNASGTNFFGNVDTVDIERFLIGFEKTALDGRVSAELRIPLLLQLDSDLSGDKLLSGDRSGEFGNMSVTLKALIAARRKFALGAGLAVNIPTAEDLTVRQTVDTPLVIDPGAGVTGLADFSINGQFQNDTTSLIPYLAWLFKPTDRFFQQGFLQIDVPLNSSDASLDVDGVILPDSDYDTLDITNSQTGNIELQTLLRLNMGFGYWLKQGRKNGQATGLAALMEVHYTTDLGDGSAFEMPLGSLNDPSATLPDIPLTARAGTGDADFDVVNLSSGLALDLGGCVITNGVIVPISDDRYFDFEYNLQINKRF